MTVNTGRGAQVILDGLAQAAARGSYATSLIGNVTEKQALEFSGRYPTGNTERGLTSSGLPPVDPLFGWSSPRAYGPEMPTIESFSPSIVGDGVTDDSVAIRAAHDAAYAAGVREVWCAAQYYAPTAYNLGNVHFRGPGALIGTYRKYVIPAGARAAQSPPSVAPTNYLRIFSQAIAPIVVIVGDSTSVPGSNNLLGMNIWTQLQNAIRRDNPGKTITFYNRGIGGSTLSNFSLGGSGTSTGLTLPSWYTVAASSWSSYINALSPDLIICNWGTNGPTGTLTAAWNAAKALWNAYTKIPDVIMITNLPPSTQTYAGSLQVAGMSERDGAAGSTRTYAEYYGYGLIDIHRQATMARDGFDPCDTLLTLNAAVTTGGKALPYTCTEYTTDFYVTFIVDNTANAVFGAAAYVEVSLSTTAANVIRFEIGGGGLAKATYYGGNGSLTFGLGGTMPVNATVALTVLARGSFVSVYIEGTLVLEANGIRAGGPFLPVISSSLGALASPVLNLTAFYTSTPALNVPTLTDLELFGLPSLAYSGLGNGNNHPANRVLTDVTKPMLDIADFSPAGGVSTVQSITAAAAIITTVSLVKLTGPAASTYAITLAAPAAADQGHVLCIEMIATTAADAVTLALTNCVGGTAATTASFDAAGETLVLIAHATKWVIFKELGVTLS